MDRRTYEKRKKVEIENMQNKDIRIEEENKIEQR